MWKILLRCFHVSNSSYILYEHDSVLTTDALPHQMANTWRTISGYCFVSISSCKKYCGCKCASSVCKIIIIYINNRHNSLPYPSSPPSLLHSLSSPAALLSFFLSFFLSCCILTLSIHSSRPSSQFAPLPSFFLPRPLPLSPCRQ